VVEFVCEEGKDDRGCGWWWFKGLVLLLLLLELPFELDQPVELETDARRRKLLGWGWPIG
jgi:hypothetical protein